MILSRNWLNEFVDLKDITDKEFNDEMTLSGSKVETIERPDENLKNVVVGKILEMKRHENSDHMWVCQIDVGQAEPCRSSPVRGTSMWETMSPQRCTARICRAA